MQTKRPLFTSKLQTLQQQFTKQSLLIQTQTDNQEAITFLPKEISLTGRGIALRSFDTLDEVYWLW